MTQIYLGIGVLVVSWLAARLAKVTGTEDSVFAISMLAFVIFAAVAILFPTFGTTENNPIYLGVLVFVVLFGFMSAWMSQE